jgi:hypothetical protein
MRAHEKLAKGKSACERLLTQTEENARDCHEGTTTVLAVLLQANSLLSGEKAGH